MIGTVFFPGNEVYVFLSDEEFKKIDLEKKLEGDFINSQTGIKGWLKFSVCKDLKETAEYLLNKESEVVKNLEVFVWEKAYESKKPGAMSFHLGYAHVNVRNIASMGFNEQNIYAFLFNCKAKSF